MVFNWSDLYSQNGHLYENKTLKNTSCKNTFPKYSKCQSQSTATRMPNAYACCCVCPHHE